MHHVSPAPVVSTILTQSGPADFDQTRQHLGMWARNSIISSRGVLRTSRSLLPRGTSTDSLADEIIPSQITVEDVELTYLLEDEERRRIRERKESISAGCSTLGGR
jgi:hypothetical protein